MMRIAILTLVALATLVGGCGGSDEPAPPAPLGSVDNPVPARTAQPGAESAPAEGTEPGYTELLEQQSSKPRSRFSPCNLVTRAQAGSYMRASVRAPVEAPQGPTCVYRTEKGDDMVTVAVQALPFERVARKLRDSQRLEVGRHAAICGTSGQPVVLVELPRDRVLSIAAPCPIGMRFAATALQRLA